MLRIHISLVLVLRLCYPHACEIQLFSTCVVISNLCPRYFSMCSSMQVIALSLANMLQPEYSCSVCIRSVNSVLLSVTLERYVRCIVITDLGVVVTM